MNEHDWSLLVCLGVGYALGRIEGILRSWGL